MASTIRGVLQAGGSVVLSVNMDSHNMNAVTELLEILEQQGLNREKNLMIYFAAVRYGPDYRSLPYFETHKPLSLETYAKVRIRAFREAMNRGFRVPELFSGGLCSLKTANTLIVDTYGNLYKCVTLTGTSDAWVGTVREPVEVVYRRVAQLDMAEPWKNPECASCVYLPMCTGGCPQQAMIEHPETPFPHGIWCIKPYFDHIFPDALEIYEQQRQSSPRRVLDRLI